MPENETGVAVGTSSQELPQCLGQTFLTRHPYAAARKQEAEDIPGTGFRQGRQYTGVNGKVGRMPPEI